MRGGWGVGVQRGAQHTHARVERRTLGGVQRQQPSNGVEVKTQKKKHPDVGFYSRRQPRFFLS